jgi:hypothetical protein
VLRHGSSIICYSRKKTKNYEGIKKSDLEALSRQSSILKVKPCMETRPLTPIQSSIDRFNYGALGRNIKIVFTTHIPHGSARVLQQL